METPTPPQTMTNHGLSFLEQLAGKCETGVILEIGPLFGSSTNALARGRQPGVAIHTIDTFENAPWVHKRTGEDLSRAAFDKYTAHIDDLVVHQGYSPTVVEDSWTDTIGLYFDDATHGNPNWLESFDFFAKSFADDVIMCGDDFASGWPDIITNVYDLRDRLGCTLYVIGRVWALTSERQNRIEEAVDSVFPNLSGSTVTVYRGDDKVTTKAAVWSDGLHTPFAIDGFSIESDKLDATFVTYSGDSEVSRVPVGGGKVDLHGVDGVVFESTQRARVQYCCVNARGKTANSSDFPPGAIFHPEDGDRIVAVRLSL